jgi:hypothetical protein
MSENNDQPLSEIETQPTQLLPTKKSKKKIWMVLGLIIVIAVLVSAVAALNFTAPNGQIANAQTVSLGFSYSQGEIMEYSMQITASVTVEGVPQPSSSSTQTATITQEVLNTDEDTYTIRVTTKSISPSAGSSSYTMTMDKSGKIIDYGDLPAEAQQMMQSMSTIPGFGSYFPKQEAKVGESWQVPINLQFSGMSLVGTVNYKIVATNPITVPAGTYDVVSIEITSDDLKMSLTSLDESMVFQANYDGQIDLEKDTCRMIQLEMDVALTATIEGQTGTINSSMQMQLEQYTK